METTEFFAKILRENPLFTNMPDAQIETIAGCAKNVRFKAGETIFSEGDNADLFFIVREGQVAIDLESPDSDVITIQTLAENEVIGWSWLFPPYTWQYNARAVADTRAVALDGKCLRGKTESDSALGFELMKRFSAVVLERLQATRFQLMDIYGPGPKATA